MSKYIEDPDYFTSLLQKRWGNLFFSRVTNVVFPKSSFSNTYTPLYKDGAIHSNGSLYECDMNKFKSGECIYQYGRKRYIDEVDHIWEHRSYAGYYGFCTTGPISNDNVPFYKTLNIRPDVLKSQLKNKRGLPMPESVFFHHSNYSALDFEVNRDGWFGDSGNTNGGYNPPKVGDIVCGLVTRDDETNKLKFSKWFTCTEQFYKLWKLVMFGLPPNITAEQFLQNIRRRWNYQISDEISKDEKIEQFDPDESRFSHGEINGNWFPIAEIILGCKHFQPFQRDFYQRKLTPVGEVLLRSKSYFEDHDITEIMFYRLQKAEIKDKY